MLPPGIPTASSLYKHVRLQSRLPNTQYDRRPRLFTHIRIRHSLTMGSRAFSRWASFRRTLSQSQIQRCLLFSYSHGLSPSRQPCQRAGSTRYLASQHPKAFLVCRLVCRLVVSNCHTLPLTDLAHTPSQECRHCLDSLISIQRFFFGKKVFHPQTSLLSSFQFYRHPHSTCYVWLCGWNRSPHPSHTTITLTILLHSITLSLFHFEGPL